jgi:hypothetical protein
MAGEPVGVSRLLVTAEIGPIPWMGRRIGVYGFRLSLGNPRQGRPPGQPGPGVRHRSERRRDRPDGQSRSQVNRVERTQTRRSEVTGPVKQGLVETNKVECTEKPSSNAN